MGFGNGKVLKLEFNLLNLDKESSVVDQAMRAAELNNLMQIGEKINESQDSQIFFVSTKHPKMQKVWTEHGEAIIAACDKPVIFYKHKDSIEMQYLATGLLQ